MMTTIDSTAEDIIRQNTCGYTDCMREPAWQVQTLHIKGTDGLDCELAGFQDSPINRVCEYHQKDPDTHKLIANKGWLIVLRSLEMENPQWFAEIGKDLKLTHFTIGWKEIG